MVLIGVIKTLMNFEDTVYLIQSNIAVDFGKFNAILCFTQSN